jgi:uncharacterized membrane protein YfcA
MIGSVMGTLSGLLGIGGGVIAVPLMCAVNRSDIRIIFGICRACESEIYGFALFAFIIELAASRGSLAFCNRSDYII